MSSLSRGSIEGLQIKEKAFRGVCSSLFSLPTRLRPRLDVPYSLEARSGGMG